MFNRLASHCASLAVLAAVSLAPSVCNAQQGRPTFSAFIEDAGPRYTSNAFLSEKAARSDIFTSPATGIGVSGLFAPGLAYSFSGMMVNNRFRRFSELDDDTVVLAGSMAYTSGPWTLAAEYSPKWVYTREFDALSVELHDLTAVIKGAFKLNVVSISPTLSVRRRLSDLDLAENTRFGAGVGLSWKASERGVFKVAPGVTYSIFDASPVAGTDRKDLWAGLNVDYIYSVTPSIDLVMSAGAGYNHSTVDGRSWKSFGASPSLSLSTKF
jgi:hypothetical protein